MKLIADKETCSASAIVASAGMYIAPVIGEKKDATEAVKIKPRFCHTVNTE